MLFAWSTIVTSLISQIWRFKLGFKGSGYRFCNVFVPNNPVFTMVCRLLLSIKITIVLRWTIAFRTNCIWSKMTLLNKVCHTVGKTSRECQCVFVAEGLHSGCSPGLFAHLLSLQRRSSSRRPTSKAASLSFFLCRSAQNHFRPQQVFQPYLLLHLPFNKCRNPAHASWFPCALTTYPLFPAPQHMLVS